MVLIKRLILIFWTINILEDLNRCKIKWVKIMKLNISIIRKMIIVLAFSFVIIIVASTLFADVDYENSLVGYWDFDEGSGTTASDSAGVNNGTLINDPIWTTGVYGSALSFDATNYVNAGNHESLNITGDIAIGAWIKTSSTEWDMIIQKYELSPPYRGYGLSVQNVLLFWSTSIDWKPSTVTVNDNNWHHVVVTGSGPTGEIYIDGSESGTFSYTAPSDNLSVPLYIGSYAGGDNYKYNGLIDDLSIWNRALASDEVSSMYNVGVQSFEGILEGVTITFGNLEYTTKRDQTINRSIY